MENDLSKYRQKFVEDAIELLEKLDANLLILEQRKDDNEQINNVFRAMHTLKGVSAMYGFEIIGEFTHLLENIYASIRDENAKVTKEIIDLTLKASDHIKNLLNDINLENITNISNHEKLINIINSVENSFQNIEKKEKKDNITYLSTGFCTYNILIKPSNSYFKRNIKVINIFNELFNLGEYKIKNHIFNKVGELTEYVSVYLATDKNIEEISNALYFIIDDCEIHKIADFNIFNKEEFDLRTKTFIENKTNYEEVQLTENEISVPDKIQIEEKVTGIIKNNKINVLEIQSSHEPTVNRISVDSKKLDRLMYLVSELIIANAQLSLATQDKYYKNIWQHVEKFNKLSKEFKVNAFSIRLVPINDLILKFQRLVRDLSSNLNKQIDFTTQGADTELDKNTIDILAEPLMHIIRNCIDHGIELPEKRQKLNKPPKGLIKLTAYHSGNYVFIQISDDGNGIDLEVIKNKAIENGFIKKDEVLTKKQILELIFLPGFSTAQNLTEVSGRGVGMDIVKKRIEQIRGEIDIETEIGLGTSFTIKLHQTISIIDSLLVQIGENFLIIPLEDVVVCGQVKYVELIKRDFFGTIEHNNELVPFINLRKIFKIDSQFPETAKLVYIKRNEKFFGLAVDCIIGQYQTVLKPLDSTFKNQKYISSVSILGDGNLALMLDVNALSELIIKTKQ